MAGKPETEWVQVSRCKIGIDGEMVDIGEMLWSRFLATSYLPDDCERNHGRLLAMAEKPCNVGGIFGLAMIPGHMVMSQRRPMPEGIYPPPPPVYPDDDGLSGLPMPADPDPDLADWFGGPDGSVREARISGKTWQALSVGEPLYSDGNGFLRAAIKGQEGRGAIVKARLQGQWFENKRGCRFFAASLRLERIRPPFRRSFS